MESTSTDSPSKDKCSICGGLGYILVKKRFEAGEDSYEADSVKACQCNAQRRVERLVNNSGLSEHFRALRFDNFITAKRPECVVKAYHASLDYTNRFAHNSGSRNNSLMLLGTPGSGKTHLICAVANALLGEKVACLYAQWVETMSKIKESTRDGSADELIRKIRVVPVLLLDDLFKPPKNPTDFELETAFSIINYRYLNHLPLLVSSERIQKDLWAIDQALSSRLIEMAKGHLVELQGNPADLNYRLR